MTLALPATSEVISGALFVKCNDDKNRLNTVWIGSKGSPVFSPHLRNRAPGRIAVNYMRVCISRTLDRNADNLRQTITDVCEQDPALGATGRDDHELSEARETFGPKMAL